MPDRNPHRKRKVRKTLKTDYHVKNVYKHTTIHVFIHHACQFIIMWTGLSILACCLVSWYACGNLTNNVTTPKQDVDAVVTNTSELVHPAKANGIDERKGNQAVVELTDTLPDDEDNTSIDETSVFSPSVAPATPRVFLHPSSVFDAASISSSPPVPVTPLTSSVAVTTPEKSPASDPKADTTSAPATKIEEQTPPIAEKSLDPSSAPSEEIGKPIIGGDLEIVEDKKGGAPGFDKSQPMESTTDKNFLKKAQEEKEAVEKATEEESQLPNGKVEIGEKLKTVEEVVSNTQVDSAVPVTPPTPIFIPKDPEASSTPDVMVTTTQCPQAADDVSKKAGQTKTEEVIKKDDSKMLSFTEWKMKHDREKEIKEKELEESEEIVKTVEGDVNATVATKKKKTTKKKLSNKKNYASPNCGAKVISANKEAQNSNAILKEDKDVYMLNPCNVEAWVVIELCERIQLYSIDFANFEMFSSTPEKVSIHVANRFPTRDWEFVEEFGAKAGREVQTFQVKEKFYAKYIKLEVLKYIGNEHYCPLSLLRVFGMTEVEEFEDNDETDTHAEDESDVTGSQNEEKSGIFESAKQAVVGLVSNVAKTFTGQKDESQAADGRMNGSEVVTLMMQGDHVTEFFDDTSFLTTCIQRTLYSEYNTSLNPICHLGLTYMFMKKMCPSLSMYRSLKVTKQIVVSEKSTKKKNTTVPPIPPPPLKPPIRSDEDSKEEKERQKSVEVPVTQQEVKIEKVKKIETTKSVEAPPSSTVVATARDILHELATTSTPTKAGEDGTCSTKKHSIDVTKLVQQQIQPSFVYTESSTKSSVTLTKALEVIDNKKAIDSPFIDKIEATSETKTVQTTVKPKQESVDVLEFKVNHTDTSSMVAEKVEKEKAQEDKPESLDVAKETLDVAPDDLGNDAATVTATKDLTDEEPASVPSASDPKEVKTEETEKTADQPVLTQEINKETLSTSQPSEPVSSTITAQPQESIPITTTTPSPDSTSSEKLPSTSSKTKTPQSLVASGGLAGSKESIVVKLSAKIKALQHNLTMSMMYLEEMSERYRTAVEEVDKRHEKKTFALNVSLKSQQDIIQHQAELISNLTRRIEKLTLHIQNVTETFQKQHEMMAEKHVFWVSIEIFLIIFLLVFCGRRAPSKQSPKAEGGNVEVLNKGKSEIIIPISHQNGFIKKKRSHSTAENLFKPKNNDVLASIEEIELEASKRKKRKRQISLPPTKPESMKDSSLSKTAGLLFSAGKGILSGLTGAFYYGSEKTKPSRRADALIDPIHKPGMKKKEKMLRRAKSFDLATVVEEVTPVTDFQLTSVSHFPPSKPERPKSADSYLYAGAKKHRKVPKTVGRFG